MIFFKIWVFGVFPALFIAAVVVGEAIRQRVKNHHPEIWVQYGSPRSLQFEKLNGLLVRGAYQALGDPRLSRLCAAMLWIRRGFLVLGSVWLVSITYRRPLVLGAIVLLVIGVGILNRYARRRQKRAA